MIFLDSGFILAYVNESDPHHSDALPLMKRIFKGEFGKIFISDFVVTEVLTLSRVRTKSCECAKSIDDLLNRKKDNKDIFFRMFVDSAVLKQATTKFHKFCSEGYSHTDCSILIIMKMFSIQFLASFDSHFRGLVSVLP
ncbi:MAG: type II toxin-antitoxin system VapC family toxin [Candidatus Heimdallarchaeota archaeon]|nr:type II toxin-antitoxin system VapC family toxin [Candidatus Heimdallarchaeota archaeon]